MGRRATGWRLRKKGDWYYVRFTLRGRESELATGESEPGRAAKAAAEIYAHAVQHPPRQRRAGRAGTLVEQAGESWLNAIALTLDPGTVAAYAVSLDTHLAPWFGTVEQVTTERAAEYVQERLRVVKASTVRKELAALRGLLSWLYGDEAPRIKGPPKRAVGTTHERRSRRKAPPVTRAEVLAMLEHMPERSRGGWPIRARFVVAYETTLRPEALDLLETPLNYREGDETIRLEPWQDKTRAELEVPLSPWARRELDAVLPDAGEIFGKHDYRPHVRAAAKAVLSPDRAAVWCGAHFRSAGITRYAGEQPLVAQVMAGHKHFSTTSGYVKASLAMAKAHVSGKYQGT